MVAVYTPQEPSPDYPEMITALDQLLYSYGEEYDILPGGDWNCMIDGPHMSTNRGARASQEALKTLIASHQLYDVQAELSHSKMSATNVHNKTSRRLDRCYASLGLAHQVADVKIATMIGRRHCPLSASQDTCRNS